MKGLEDTEGHEEEKEVTSRGRFKHVAQGCDKLSGRPPVDCRSHKGIMGMRDETNGRTYNKDFSRTRRIFKIKKKKKKRKPDLPPMCHHHTTRYSNKMMSVNLLSRKSVVSLRCILACLTVSFCIYEFELLLVPGAKQTTLPNLFRFAEASLIVGDSAIEIHEVDTGSAPAQSSSESSSNSNEPAAVILGTSPPGKTASDMVESSLADGHKFKSNANSMPGPLPPMAAANSNSEGSAESGNNDQASGPPADRSNESVPVGYDKAIAGKVVDFELTPAGGHNKAKIKKKKKKKKEEESEMFKKWAKKKKEEKKFKEMQHKEEMKKKKEEGKKKKKKWGHQEHGMKKKGNFKKKKWGKKVKKGKGVKKGKKGKKFLKDKGHKNTGFKTVYHKEEYGVSKKWHDIKRKKEWDESAKKWKKKWDKEKGKKYKGDHMKKFLNKKKDGKKYHKENKDKYKKFKKEKYEKGKKKKMEEYGKKKEGGKKKKQMEMKKKKKKKKP